MNNTIYISIVIPAYNAGKFIGTTIENVLKQSYQNFEIIIVNDGSSDHTKEVLDTWTHPKIKVCHQRNSGVSVARNKGISISKYPYIAFLDADDNWHNDYLLLMASTIEKYPKAKLFLSGRILVYPNRNERYSNPIIPKDKSIAEVDYIDVIETYEPCIHTSSVIIKKSHFSKTQCNFRDGQAHYEDLDLWLRLAHNEPIIMLNEPLSYYRKDIEGSATTKIQDPKDLFRYLATICETLIDLNQDKKFKLLHYSEKLLITQFNKQIHAYPQKDKEMFIFFSNQLIINPIIRICFKLMVRSESYVLSRLFRRWVKMPTIY